MKLVEEMSDSSAKVLLEKTTEYLYDENGNELATSTSYLRPTGGTLKKSLRGSVHGENQPTEPDILIERTNNTFDGFNRLKAVEKIEDGIRTSVEYTYNGDDLRTQKVVKSSDNSYTPRATSFLYDRQHVLLETDATGEVQTRYIRGINYIAQYSSVGNGYSGGNEQELSYFLFNGHGDTVQTVTETGEIQNQYDYDIFGSPTLTIEIAACSIRYAGEYLDNETGLYYLRARYYDPYVGRFISEDSYWGEDTNPLSLNLYTYAYNNPERFIDPTGHRPTEAEIEIQRKIAQIDSLKRLWHEVENDSFVDYTSSKQDFQKMISDVATENKDKLIGLEQGKIDDISNIIGQMGHMNKDAYDFIKDYKTSEINTMISLIEADKKGVKGSWAAYKLIKSVEAIEYSKRIDNNVQAEIKDRAKEYFYAIAGFDVYGISEAEIKQEIKTSAELFAEYYLSNQIQKVSFMNEETSPEYTPYDPIFNRWTLLDTFINAARTSPFGDKNPNDTRWMRKFYYENVWDNRLLELLEGDLLSFDPAQIDNDYWLDLMGNNFRIWLNDVANLKTKEALQTSYNWESGQFVVDIAVTTFAAVIAAKATPVVLSLGKPITDMLSAVGKTLPSLANDGGQLATTIGINLSSNAVILNDVLVYAEAACMTQALTLEQAIMTMSGGNPEQLINMINAGSGYYSSASSPEGRSNSTKDLKVIGRLEDTAVAKNWKGHDVLNDPNWTLAKNDEWVNAGIKNKQDFYIASPMTEKNLVSTNPKYPGPTVFAREIDMLKKAGYVQKGDYFIHPSNLK
jgi:RHS repeat-associated protein